jgi:hypothetical protein
MTDAAESAKPMPDERLASERKEDVVAMGKTSGAAWALTARIPLANAFRTGDVALVVE